MITIPSMSNLLAGLIQNFEKVEDAAPDEIKQLLTPALSILDRVSSEWYCWGALLEEDNADIRETLKTIGVAPPPQAAEHTECGSLNFIQALEENNRELKDALVDAIETFDLPVPSTAAADLQQIDATVLALLRRMLHRENRVPTPPARTSSTSGNLASSSLSPAELENILVQFLQAEMPDASGIVLSNLAPIAGGASREAWVFDVTWASSGEACSEACIFMREPVASVLVSDESATVINGTRRTVAAEVRVVDAMAKAGLPVPSVLWHDPVGKWLERPFSISGRLPGSADAAQIQGEHAEALLQQYVDILTQIHELDPQQLQLDFLGKPTAESAAREQVEQYEGNFIRQRLEAFPATTYIIRWLKKHAPCAGRISVVHGDYRLGNFLFEKDRMIAILDWEQVHIGDPVEEIAFMYWHVWSLEALCPIEDFVRRYEQAAGYQLDREALAYYRVHIEFKMLVVLFTSLKSFFATAERQLHYGSAQTPEMIREAQLRVIEALYQGGPTVAFDAYQKSE
ncbi:MAG: aminoglycoside phosphotransferase (APT) family kinase protein [Limisphaerales bacterium]|jgi:aminoglycoside phosphotransferase (APT) family kinase protein